MKDFKIIATERRDFFEEKIKEYMQQGYVMKHTNMSSVIKKPTLEITPSFYAYMEKDEI